MTRLIINNTYLFIFQRARGGNKEQRMCVVYYGYTCYYIHEAFPRDIISPLPPKVSPVFYLIYFSSALKFKLRFLNTLTLSFNFKCKLLVLSIS